MNSNTNRPGTKLVHSNGKHIKAIFFLGGGSRGRGGVGLFWVRAYFVGDEGEGGCT